MDLNIKVKIESPDIMNAILALAEAIPQIKQVPILKDNLQEQTEKISKVKEVLEDVKEIKQEAKVVTLEEVRAKLTNLSQNGKQAEVKALIKKYGAVKLTDISPENYADLLKETEKI